jgi:hypothetical protein
MRAVFFLDFIAHIHFHSFVCTDAGFTGNCGVFTGTSGECINFPSSFNDDITAVGPDDGQDCFFYMQVFPLKCRLPLHI